MNDIALKDSAVPPTAKMRGRTSSTTSVCTNASERLEQLYEHGKNLENRRKELQENAFDVKGYTFKPVINKSLSGKVRTRPDSNETFERLYKNALEMRKKQVKEIERIEQLETPTFKPCTLAKNGHKRESPNAKTQQELFDKLYASAISQQEKQEKLRCAFLPHECTFSPRTNGRHGEHINTGYSQKRLNELYEEGLSKYERREEAKKKQDLQHSFHPLTNSMYMSESGVSSMVSIESNVSKLCPSKDEMFSRQHELEMIRQDNEVQGCTFAPVTNPLKSKKRDKRQVYKRLYDNAKALREKKDDLIEAMTSEIMNRNSDSLGTRSYGSGLLSLRDQSVTTDASRESVFNRLYENGVNKLQTLNSNHKQAKAKREDLEWRENEEECTFNPTISSVAKALKQPEEDSLDSFTRLYIDAELRKDKREFEFREREGLDLQCTFHPQLNHSSKKISHDNTSPISPKPPSPRKLKPRVKSPDPCTINITPPQQKIQKVSRPKKERKMSPEQLETQRMQQLASMFEDDEI